jgi:aryl-alcohol dehydrogenase
LPAVLGHEGAGTVVAVGDAVTRVAPGDRVVLSYDSCGHCPTCAQRRPSYCHEFVPRNFGGRRPDGTSALSRDGAPLHAHFFGQSSFAERAVSREDSVVKVDADIPFALLAPLGCGIQTGAGAILNVMRPPAGSSVAVFGTGTVGLAAVMAARATGATTIVGVDVNPARLQLARELGATHTVNAAEEDVVEVVKEATGMGADFAVESTGVPEVLRQAVDSSAPTGMTGVIGAPAMGTEVSLDVTNLLVPGRTVRGIVEGDSVPDVFIPRLIELWQQGRFPMDRLMRTYDFDQIEEAADHSGGGQVVKAVLRM